jgi:Zn-dependent protease with chaperone function
MKKLVIGMILLTQTQVAGATIYKREKESCLPLTNLIFGSNDKSLRGLNESDYNQILDKVQSVMGPDIQKRLNKNLIIDRKWTDPTVDAYATRDDTDNPVIVINGGLARHPQMTRDGFLLLVCHELGHHLGGAPKFYAAILG